MNIDLTLLHNYSIDEIEINDKYSIPDSYFENSNVLELKNIEVCGKITLVASEDDYDLESDYMKCTIKGTMKIEDSISLEPVDYKFEIEYDDYIEENCKTSENSLDIFAFLWENIVLEVPLQFTKVEDLESFQGDGWRLVSEEEATNSNYPFKDLLKDIEKE